MTAKKSRGFLALENYLAADHIWAYIIQMAAWTYVMFQTIDAPFISVQWVVAYVRETNGAAQLFVLTTIIGVNIWRIAVKFWQERVKSVKEQVDEGKAEGRNEVITALRKGGMSRDQINAVLIRSGDKDLISEITLEDASDAFMEAFLEAANRINAASEKTDHESEKPDSEL